MCHELLRSDEKVGYGRTAVSYDAKNTVLHVTRAV